MRVFVAVVVAGVALPGCAQKKGKKGGDKEALAHVQALKAKLDPYDFAGKTPRYLRALHQASKEYSGEARALALYHLATAYLDWTLVALGDGDRKLLDALFKHLELPVSCTAGRGGPGKVLTPRCAGKLRARLSDAVAEMVAAGGSHKAHKEWGAKADKLIGYVLEMRTHDAAVVASVGGLDKIAARPDAVGVRAQVLIAARAVRALARRKAGGPGRDGFTVGAAVPWACPQAFAKLAKLRDAASVHGVMSKKGVRCSYVCPEVGRAAVGTAALHRAVAAKCGVADLGMSRRWERRFFTQASAAAFRSLAYLVTLGRSLAGQKTNRLVRYMQPTVDRLRDALKRLRVRLPYPPVIDLQGDVIEAPQLPFRGGPAPRARVHLALSASRAAIGVAAVLGVREGSPSLLLPKGVQAPAGTAHNLIGGDKLSPKLTLAWSKTRRAAQDLGGRKGSERLAIYAGRKLPAVRLLPIVEFARKRKIIVLELVYVFDIIAGAADRALTLQIDPPAKGAAPLPDLAAGDKMPDKRAAAWTLSLAKSGTVQTLVLRVGQARRQGLEQPIHLLP